MAKGCIGFTGLKQAMSCMRAGSELHLAVEAAKELEGAGKKARVVSMLSWEVFDEQVRLAQHVPAKPKERGAHGPNTSSGLHARWSGLELNGRAERVMLYSGLLPEQANVS